MMTESIFESKIFLPNRKLMEWIKLYWFLEGQGFGATKKNKHVLPDGCTTIVFILKGSITLSAYNNQTLTEGIYIIPPVLKSHEDVISDDIYLIDIQLNPGVFYKLFNLPVNELVCNQVYSFDELSIPFDKSILSKLISYKENKFLLLNEINMFFFDVFYSATYVEDQLLHNLCELYKHGNLDSFYDNQSLSMRQIQRKIKSITGLTPKTISRISRFYKILENREENSRNIHFNNLHEVEKISDQSHLIKEFKYFTGISPVKFFNTGDNYLQFKAIANTKIYEESLL